LTWRRTDSKNVSKKSHWYILTSPQLENPMPVVARDVHETRLCDHFHVAGESAVLQISVPDQETKDEGVRIWFQRDQDQETAGSGEVWPGSVPEAWEEAILRPWPD